MPLLVTAPESTRGKLNAMIEPSSFREETTSAVALEGALVIFENVEVGRSKTYNSTPPSELLPAALTVRRAAKAMREPSPLIVGLRGTSVTRAPSEVICRIVPPPERPSNMNTCVVLVAVSAE